MRKKKVILIMILALSISLVIGNSYAKDKKFLCPEGQFSRGHDPDGNPVCESIPNFSTCVDNDGDGFYAQAGCGSLADCNDNDSNINPSVVEQCDDQVDNDCDGVINNDCVVGCSSSEAQAIQSCYNNNTDSNAIQDCLIEADLRVQCNQAIVNLAVCAVQDCLISNDLLSCYQSTCPTEFDAVFGALPSL